MRIKKQNVLEQTIKSPIVIGKIGSPYGIRGWVKFFSFTEKYKNIFFYHPWFICIKKNFQIVELEDWKSYKKKIILKIKKIDNRTQANLLTNINLIIDKKQLLPLSKNEYYWADLIGCIIVNVITHKTIGKVKNLLETKFYDILIVTSIYKKNIKAQEWLIPFIENKIIKSVNLKKKIIQINWNNLDF